jgi:uncharacterized SAM-binding protein YcdF (DUF218 family)
MRYNLWFLFGPVSWPAWAWIGAVLAQWANRPGLSRRLWFWGGLWGVAITASPLGHILIQPLERQYPVPNVSGRIDGILMLTGAERLEQSTTHRQPVLNEAGERVLLAVMLHHRFPGALLVAVGGVADGASLRDTDIAYSAFVRSGVARDRIRLINGTTDTCTNASASRRVMKPGTRWLLVTSAAHMPRAMACYRAAGLSPVPYPADFRGRAKIWQPVFSPGGTTNLTTFDFAAHEWAGLLYYRLTGRIDSIGT